MSFLLSLMHTVGKLVLSLMPGLADKRPEELFTTVNYGTGGDLVTYVGIKTSLVLISLGIVMLVPFNPMMLFIPIPVAIGAWFISDFLLRLPIMRQHK